MSVAGTEFILCWKQGSYSNPAMAGAIEPNLYSTILSSSCFRETTSDYYTFRDIIHCSKCNPNFRDITLNVEENEIFLVVSRVSRATFHVLSRKIDYLLDSVETPSFFSRICKSEWQTYSQIKRWKNDEKTICSPGMKYQYVCWPSRSWKRTFGNLLVVNTTKTCSSHVIKNTPYLGQNLGFFISQNLVFQFGEKPNLFCFLRQKTTELFWPLYILSDYFNFQIISS